MKATKRTIIWALFLLQLLFAGLVTRHFWPRAVEIEDVALIRLLPGDHSDGDMVFTKPTILQLTDGYYIFRDVSAPASLYIGPTRTNVHVSARTITITGIFWLDTPVPWWKKAMAKLPLL